MTATEAVQRATPLVSYEDVLYSAADLEGHRWMFMQPATQ